MGRYDILLQTDQKPSSPPPEQRKNASPQPVSTSAPPSGPTPARDTDRPIARSPRRTLVRVAFEFYDDQIQRLRKRALQEKLDGGKGSMSEWVRDAIDEWFAKKQLPED